MSAMSADRIHPLATPTAMAPEARAMSAVEPITSKAPSDPWMPFPVQK